jgi:ABC-2 type transport system permease protein
MISFLQQLELEFRAIVEDKAVLITIVGGILFYAGLYPQPYLNNLPQEQSIAVVDLDGSATSRRLIRWADATPDAHVSHRVDNVWSARLLLTQGDVRGMLVVPYGFEKDLALGRSPTVALAGDANYFLVYGTIVEGLVGAISGIGASHRVRDLVLGGAPIRFAANDWTPAGLNSRPLFNVSMGYLGYVVPAIFIMILHQTLLLAAGLIGASQNEASRNDSDTLRNRSIGKALSARFLAMFIIYFLLAQFYMGACFEFYDIARNAKLNDLWLMITAFVAATSALGVLIGVLIPRRELVAPLVMASSLPLVFTAGFVWPLESIPQPIVAVSQLAPSTSAIQAFLKLNQMGAEFSQVAQHWSLLIVLAIVYMGASAVILRRRQRGAYLAKQPALQK